MEQSQQNLTTLLQRNPKTLEYYRSLSGQEKDIALQLIKNQLGDGEIFKDYWKIDYEYPPPTIRQFLLDPYYFGRFGKSLYPKWVEDMEVVFSPTSQYLEWVMRGAIGIGKSFTANIGLGYLMCKLLCLKDPAAYHGLAPQTPLVIGLFNITKELAEKVDYAYLKTFLNNSPFFKEIAPKLKKSDEIIDFGKNVQIALGSDASHALGQNLYAGLMDEVNFSKYGANSYDISVVKKKYAAIKSRLASRFKRVPPGLFFLLSSERRQTGFINIHTEKQEGTGETYSSNYTLWEVEPELYEGKPVFHVAIGDQNIASRILTDEEAEKYPGEKIAVPKSFQKRFEYDLESALEDIAGIAVVGTGRLFSRPNILHKAIDDERSHPFTAQTLTICIDDNQTIEEFFNEEQLFYVSSIAGKGKHYSLKHFKDSLRWGHIDIGLTQDGLGLAIGCFGEHYQEDREKEMKFSELRKVVHIDLMLKIVPRPGSEIDLEKVRLFILYLKKLGMKFHGISYDGYQSRHSIQMLKKSGIEAETISVDRTPVPYEVLKSAFLERALSYYEYPEVIRELSELLKSKTTGKIDHPSVGIDGEAGSKDVADALAAVVFKLTEINKGLGIKGDNFLEVARSTAVLSQDSSALGLLEDDYEI